MAGEAAIEIFAEGFAHPPLDMGAKGISDIQILSRNPQTHGVLSNLLRRSVLSRRGTVLEAAHAMVGAAGKRAAQSPRRGKARRNPRLVNGRRFYGAHASKSTDPRVMRVMFG